MKSSSAQNIRLASYDDLFGATDAVAVLDTDQESIQMIPLIKLHPFANHPFKVIDDEAMLDTVDSVKRYGVLVPAIARPLEDGGYELVAGHRRHRACALAELDEMPVTKRLPRHK